MIYTIVWRNILKKKLQMAVVVFVLIFATCITFVTIGATNVTEDVVVKTSRKYVGNSDIRITARENGQNAFFSMNQTEEFEYIKGFVTKECSYEKNHSLKLMGADLADVEHVWELNGLQQELDDIFIGNAAVVSHDFLERYALSVGDVITLTVNDYHVQVRVIAAIKPVGLFIDDGEDEFILVPKKYIQYNLGIGSRVSLALVKLKEGQDTAVVIENLRNDTYKEQEVNASLLQSDIDTQVNTQTSTYKILSITVIILSIIIIMSIFKVISYERMSDVAVLRSLGSNKWKCIRLLLMESLYYSFLACLFGCIVGIFLIFKIVDITMPDRLSNLNVQVRFTLMQFILPCSVTIIVSLISSIFPMKGITKQSIKNLLFRNVESKGSRTSFAKVAVGICMIAIAMFFDRKRITSNKLAVETICIILLIAGFMLIVSFVVKLCCRWLGWFFEKSSFDMAYLSVQNIKNDANFLTDIKVLVVGLACFLLTYATVQSVQENTMDLYRDNSKFEAMVWYDSNQSQQDIEHIVAESAYTASMYTSLFSYHHPIDGTDYVFEKIQGIDSVFYLDYWVFPVSGKSQADQLLKQLNRGRNIVITEIMLERLNKQIGSTIDILFGEEIIPYTIIGTIDSMNTNGNNGYIADKYFKEDVSDTYYKETSVYISGGLEEAIEDLDSLLSEKEVTIFSLDELERKNYDSYKGIYVMLQVLTFVILWLCVVGIINNRIVNFIQREKVFCIQRSIGMSRKQLMGLMVCEAMVSGLVGGFLAMILGNLLVALLPYFMKAAGQVIAVESSGVLSVIVVVFGIVISMGSSMVLVVKRTKINIIAGLKQE